MKKVCYVVQCNSGQYYDYCWWIAGIFYDVFAAEKLKQEILKEIEIIRNIEAPYEFEDVNEITDEQYDIWYEWSKENKKACEFNGVNVVEYPLGEKVNFGEKELEEMKEEFYQPHCITTERNSPLSYKLW